MAKFPSDPLIRKPVKRSLFVGGPDGKEHRDWEIGHKLHEEEEKRDGTITNDEHKTPKSNRGW